MRYADSVAVITGAAAGIGLAAGVRLRDQGANVLISDIDADALQNQVNRTGLKGVTCNVANDTDIDNLKAAAAEMGEVSLVMANAGIAIGGRFEKIPIAEWQRLFNINVLGSVRTINAFLPGMLERGKGRIVITGSSAGLFRGDGYDTPYAASKHALRAVAQGLAVYCQGSGVHVHYLAPRITDTAFPRSSIAWGNNGSRVTSNRDLGDDYDTVDDVIGALFDGIDRNEFLISLTRDTRERLASYADDLLSAWPR